MSAAFITGHGDERSAGELAGLASTADRAIVAVDAATGIEAQARRAVTILALLGIDDVEVAVDGLDSGDPRRAEIERDIRGLLARAGHGDVDAQPAVADQFDATLVWTADEPMLPGREYLMHTGDATAVARVGLLKHRLELETLGRMAARQLERDEIGEVQIALDHPVGFDPGAGDRGGFALIDRITLQTVAVGRLRFALRRAANVRRQAFDVDKQARTALKGHRPALVWLTGLPGAGKSTIANLVDRRLHGRGVHTAMLDGDNVRHGLSRDLGFTAADRVENIRRVGEVARLMVDAGLIVIASFISPYRRERRSIRELLEPGEFYEVFVDTPQAVAEQRDSKGLYAKARRGELANFTGVDAPYEPPASPELRVDTTAVTAQQAADAIVELLARDGVISP